MAAAARASTSKRKGLNVYTAAGGTNDSDSSVGGLRQSRNAVDSTKFGVGMEVSSKHLVPSQQQMTGPGVQRAYSIVNDTADSDCIETLATNAVPGHDRVREEILMKLDQAGRWQKRCLIMTKSRILIGALKPPVHREGVVFKLANDTAVEHKPSPTDLRYLVLSEGNLSLFASEMAYLQRQPSETTFNVRSLHARAASEYSAHNHHMSGLSWSIQETENSEHIIHVSCEKRTERNLWLSSLAQHKEDLISGETMEIIDAIPMEEILRVGEVGQSFFRQNENGDLADGPPERFARINRGKKGGLRRKAFSKRVVKSGHEEMEDNGIPVGFNDQAPRNFQLEKGEHAFFVQTLPDGYNSGKCFCFKPATKVSASAWLDVLSVQSDVARRDHRRKHRFRLFQKHGCAIMQSVLVQSVIATVIICSFIAIVAETQLQPQNGTKIRKFFEIVDMSFNLIFSIELALNLLFHWWNEFWADGWLRFDFVVVVLSWLQVALESLSSDIPGSKQLRVLRTFRVVRAFGRFESLKQIINSVVRSIVPVAHATTITVLVISIFCTVGVEIFKDAAPEHFSNFLRAFHTLFSLIAFGAWPEKVLMSSNEDGSVNWASVLFLYSFVLVVLIVLLQVVVAVLLDNFFRAAADSKTQEALAQCQKAKSEDHEVYPLDPMLKGIVIAFSSLEDLEERVEKLFNTVDVDRSGTVNFTELAEALVKCCTDNGEESAVRITEDEFDHLTEGQALCDDEGALHFQGFRVMILKAIRELIQRKTSDVVKHWENKFEVEALLLCNKFLLTNVNMGDVNCGGSYDASYTGWDSEAIENDHLMKNVTETPTRSYSNGFYGGEGGTEAVLILASEAELKSKSAFMSGIREESVYSAREIGADDVDVEVQMQVQEHLKVLEASQTTIGELMGKERVHIDVNEPKAGVSEVCVVAPPTLVESQVVFLRAMTQALLKASQTSPDAKESITQNIPRLRKLHHCVAELIAAARQVVIAPEISVLNEVKEIARLESVGGKKVVQNGEDTEAANACAVEMSSAVPQASQEGPWNELRLKQPDSEGLANPHSIQPKLMNASTLPAALHKTPNTHAREQTQSAHMYVPPHASKLRELASSAPSIGSPVTARELTVKALSNGQNQDFKVGWEKRQDEMLRTAERLLEKIDSSMSSGLRKKLPVQGSSPYTQPYSPVSRPRSPNSHNGTLHSPNVEAPSSLETTLTTFPPRHANGTRGSSERLPPERRTAAADWLGETPFQDTPQGKPPMSGLDRQRMLFDANEQARLDMWEREREQERERERERERAKERERERERQRQAHERQLRQSLADKAAHSLSRLPPPPPPGAGRDFW